MDDRSDFTEARGPMRDIEDGYARAAAFAAHAHRGLSCASSCASRLLAWVRDGAGYLGLPEPSAVADGDEARSQRRRIGRLPAEEDWSQLGHSLDALAVRARQLQSNDPLVALARQLQLDAVEPDKRLFAVSYTTLTPVEGLWDW